MKDQVLDAILLDISNIRAVLILNNWSIRITPNIFIDEIDYEVDPTEELWQAMEDMFYDESDI